MKYSKMRSVMVSCLLSMCLLACQTGIKVPKKRYPVQRDNDAEYTPGNYYSGDDEMLLLDQPHSEFLYQLEKRGH